MTPIESSADARVTRSWSRRNSPRSALPGAPACPVPASRAATSARYTGESCTPVRTHSSTTAGTVPAQNIMRQARSRGARLKATVLAIRTPTLPIDQAL